MLSTAGSTSLSNTSALLRVKSERKPARREQSPQKKPRSDVTVGGEISIASQTMFAILQMAEAASEDSADSARTGTKGSASPGFAPPSARSETIWWINHPLMRQDVAVHDKIDECYAEMKRIIESNPDRMAEANDFETLRAAIDDHKIKCPVTSGSRELFNIIEMFFEEQSVAAVGAEHGQ